MQREATAMNFRQNLGELLNQVQYRGDSVVVTKDGKPVAAREGRARHQRVFTIPVNLSGIQEPRPRDAADEMVLATFVARFLS